MPSNLLRVIAYAGLALALCVGANGPARAQGAASPPAFQTQVINGSAIAFYATAPECGHLTIFNVLPLNSHAPRPRFTIQFRPAVRRLYPTEIDGTGAVLNRMELPPGPYAIRGMICMAHKGRWFGTPRDAWETYATFNVYAGKTTYIGQLNLLLGTNTWRLLIDDQSPRATAEFQHAHPDLAGRFQVELAQTPASREEITP